MKRLEIINYSKKDKKEKKGIFERINDEDRILYKNNPKLMTSEHLLLGTGFGTLAGHLIANNTKGRLIGAGVGALGGYINSKRRRIQLGLDK